MNRKRHNSKLSTGCLLGAVLASVAACDPEPPKELVRRAEFGVFFGGQVQERRELPFEIDASKQTLGFRIEFSEPLQADTDIEWRLDRPSVPARAKASRTKTPEPTVSATRDERPKLGGKETARAGVARFDRTVSFEPGDPLGLWNVRVLVRGKVAIDRPFEVYDAALRAKAVALDGGT